MSLFNFSGGPLCILGNLYVLVLFARAILSWFPIRSDSPVLPIARFINTITEPLLAPFRRVIPPLGMIDISFFVAIVVVEIVTSYVLCRI